jgi:hypothetical protein
MVLLVSISVAAPIHRFRPARSARGLPLIILVEALKSVPPIIIRGLPAPSALAPIVRLTPINIGPSLCQSAWQKLCTECCRIPHQPSFEPFLFPKAAIILLKVSIPPFQTYLIASIAILRKTIPKAIHQVIDFAFVCVIDL